MTQHDSAPRVLVLGGGPDAERGVSLVSARAVAGALGDCASMVEIDTLTSDALASLPGEVVFPALHGPWGEGGALQALLERDGRPFVGSGARASRLAMDKIATKLTAASIGVPTPAAAILGPGGGDASPVGLPAVVKPVFEGSSYGVHVCRDTGAWAAAMAEAYSERERPWMVERFVPGRELTVGLIEAVGASEASASGTEWRAMPIVEVRPAAGIYDHAAKYERGDTVYVTDPDLPGAVAEQMVRDAGAVCGALGVRHLARVDFILPGSAGPGAEGDRAVLLEVNTMPGFTPTSLLPKACAAAGIGFEALCSGLVARACEGGR